MTPPPISIIGSRSTITINPRQLQGSLCLALTCGIGHEGFGLT